MTKLIFWDIYEVTRESGSIQGVMFRGRVRKYALQKEQNLLIENATDGENVVRFAIEHKTDSIDLINFIKGILEGSEIKLIKERVPNPVLSKMKVNIEDRYQV